MSNTIVSKAISVETDARIVALRAPASDRPPPSFLRRAWPLAAIILALATTIIWDVLLGYEMIRFIWFVF